MRLTRFPVLLAIPAALMAQTLQLSKSKTARGGSGSFLIRLDSPGAVAPSTLQWDLYISNRVSVGLPDIVAGSSAESAGKTIACAALPHDADTSGFRCILSGGTQAIRNGTVAVVIYKVPKQAKKGDAPVRIEKALGVSNDVKQISFRNTQGQITIR